MKRVKWWMMLGLGALALTACSEQEELDDAVADASGVALEICGSIDGVAQTRVTDNQWEAGDKIGVWMDGANLPAFVTSNGDGVFSNTGQYVYISDPKTTYHITACYPYQYKSVVSVSTSMAANPTAQSSRDYLFAEADVTVNSPKANLKFKHVMSRLIFKVKVNTSDGFQADDVFGTAEDSEYTGSKGRLTSLYSSSNFNTQTGKVTTAYNAQNFDFNSGEQDTENHILTYTLIVAPQTADGQYVHTLTSESGDREFSVDLPNIEWEAGSSYTYNITINVKKSVVNIESYTIEKWTEKDESNLKAEG